MDAAAARVVVFTGLPGTGKSTLADLTAKALGVPAFAGDWLMGAFKPAAAVLAQLDRTTYLQLYRGLLGSLVTRQLILGQSAIVDGVVTDEVITAWRALAEHYRAALSVIECICSDDTVHRRRVEGRVRGIPGWHEIGWDHVQRMRAECEPLRAERLTVDAMSPLESNAEAVLRYPGSMYDMSRTCTVTSWQRRLNVADDRSPDPRSALAAKIRADVPHSARIVSYWLGGKDNYQVDRAAGDAFAAVFPDIVPLTQQARKFLIRAVRFLAGAAGVRQFLDIGTGLPTMQNTHEIAQQVAPESRIVYVDNDPLVLAHARALLHNTTPEGVTAYVEADLHDPDVVLADARNVLNFTQPIAVLFMGVLGHVADVEEMCSIVAAVMAAVPAGSYLALYDGTNTNEAYCEACATYAETGAVPYNLRSPEQLRRCFAGLELVEPGLVPLAQWRPDIVEAGTVGLRDAYGAVARKPRR